MHTPMPKRQKLWKQLLQDKYASEMSPAMPHLDERAGPEGGYFLVVSLLMILGIPFWFTQVKYMGSTTQWHLLKAMQLLALIILNLVYFALLPVP